MADALVIENDPTDDIRRLGDWLTDAGLTLSVRRPYAGDPVPDDLDGYAALVVLGTERAPAVPPDEAPAVPPDGAPDPAAGGARDGTADGALAADRVRRLESLLRKAVRHGVATLGVGLGGQVLAAAHGGVVTRSTAGPEIGPRLVAKRDIAGRDPLWAPVPMAPDVLQWHRDEIVDLPDVATLLAASTHYPHQAFRIGVRAWGVQFHIECDTEMVAAWVADDLPLLDSLGYDPEVVVDACDAIMPDLLEAWQPFAARFAAVATGALATPESSGPRGLPLLGG